jgi:hypothetical protein
MGLFSSKIEIVAKTTVQQVFDGQVIPKIAVNASTRNVMFGEEYVDSLMDNAINTIATKVNAGYLWAKDNYHYGLPTTQLVTDTAATTAVDEVLTTLYGVGHTKVYYHFGAMNAFHFAARTLIAAHGYNPATNILGSLSTTKGTDVYLVDVIPRIFQASYDYAVAEDVLDQYQLWGDVPNAGVTLDYPTGNPSPAVTLYSIIDPLTETLTSEVVDVYYQYLLNGVITNEKLTLSVTSFDPGDDYHQAMVIKTDGTKEYFSYRTGLGTYPEVDAVFNLAHEGGGTFLPWTHFRSNFTSLLKTPTEAYDIKTLYNKGVALTGDADAYRDSTKWCNYLGINYQSFGESVQEAENIDDVIQAMMIFGVKTTGTHAVEREYLFRYFESLYILEAAGVDYGMVGTTLGSSTRSLVIKDKLFSMSFAYRGISRAISTGSVATVGKYAVMGEGSYAKQISATEYVTVTIFGPTMRYNILGQYGTQAKMGTANCLIPVDRAILRQISLIKRQELLSRAMHIVINTYVEIDHPWYSQSWFKIVMIIIIIVVSFFFPPAGGGLAAAMAAGAGAVFYYLVTAVVVSFLIQLAVKAFIDVFGLEATMFAAIVMIAASYFAPTTMAYGATTWGEVMLSVATNMSQQVVQGFQDAIVNVQEQAAEFAMTAAEKMEKLDAAKTEYLSGTNFIDSLEFVKRTPAILWGESPSDLFARTVHSGNIGVTCYSANRDFVRNALKLPQAKETFATMAKNAELTA